MTNGPYCATGSPMGRPCRTRILAPCAPAVSGASSDARTTTPVGAATTVLPTVTSPSYTYSTRVVDSPPRAAGTDHVAFAARSTCQIATSASTREAHESGGGDGGT